MMNQFDVFSIRRTHNTIVNFTYLNTKAICFHKPYLSISFQSPYWIDKCLAVPMHYICIKIFQKSYFSILSPSLFTPLNFFQAIKFRTIAAILLLCTFRSFCRDIAAEYVLMTSASKRLLT